MGSLAVDSERGVTAIFNAAIAAPAIAAAWELGILDEIMNSKVISPPKFAKNHGLDIGSLEAMVAALVIVDVLARENGLIVAGRLFDEAYKRKSIFHWAFLGSGGLFTKMHTLARNENRVGDFHGHTRDPAAIAFACREINHEFFDPTFWNVMGGIDFHFHSVLDLGCGSGERLMEILRRYPGVNGVGVDIATPSLKVAAAESAERGMSERLSFVQGDATAITYRDEFAEVDLVTCFMMGHDFWPRENCVKTLTCLREAFPKVRRFLLGDTVRILLNSRGKGEPPQNLVNEFDLPIFTLAFETAHAMMGVYLPTLDEWDEVFGEGGWRCVKKHLIQDQSLSVIFELEHA